MKAVVLALFGLLAAAGFAADPYAGYIYPSGIQAGTTNRFVVGGQNLWKLQGVYFSGKGLKVLEIRQVPSFSPPPGMQRKHLVGWLDGIAKGVKEEPVKPDDPHISDWRSNVWYQTLGSLDALELSIVERFLFTPRNPLQAAPSLRQMCIVTVAADADAVCGTYDFSLWNNSGISAPRPFSVTAFPRMAEPLFWPAHRPAAEPAVVDAKHGGVVLDGQIMPGETDVFHLNLAGGCRYSLKVAARELQPYVGDAVPGFFNAVVVVRDGKGNVIAAGDDASRFRPDPSFDFTPRVSGVYTVEIHDVLYRGRADFVYSMEVVPDAERPDLNASRSVDERGGDDGILRFSGVISEPGGRSACEFTVDEPGKRVLEVFARRKGSPLDAVLTLRKASRPEVLGRWDDVTNKVLVGTIPQAECDSIGEYDFTEAGDYIAEITDRTGHGGGDYFWNLEVRRPSPDFEVYRARSTLPLSHAKPLAVDFVIVRKDGFKGKVVLEFPENITANDIVATSGVERISSKLTYAGRKKLEFKEVRIFAKAEVGGEIVRREVVACDEYEQAFAWRHLVPARSFVLRAVPGKVPKKMIRKGRAARRRE